MEVFCCKCGSGSVIDADSTEMGCECELFSTDISYLLLDRSDAIDKWEYIDILPANCLAFTHSGNKCVTFLEVDDALEPITYRLNLNELETLD